MADWHSRLPSSCCLRGHVQIPLWPIGTLSGFCRATEGAGFRFLYGRLAPKSSYGIHGRNYSSDSSMADWHKYTKEASKMTIKCSDSSMADWHEALAPGWRPWRPVQIPLWPIGTEALAPGWRPWRPVQIPLWPIGTEWIKFFSQSRKLFRFLYGRLAQNENKY